MHACTIEWDLVQPTARSTGGEQAELLFFEFKSNQGSPWSSKVTFRNPQRKYRWHACRSLNIRIVFLYKWEMSERLRDLGKPNHGL